MPSNTQKTRNRRRNHKRTLGRDKKRARAQEGTPKFPIHAESLPQPVAST